MATYRTRTTRKPSGMTVERDGMNFTFSWKVMDADHGAGQWCKFRTNVLPKDKYLFTDITTSDTSVTIPLYPTSYYPYSAWNQLKAVTALIQGQRATSSEGSGDSEIITSYTKSDWVYKVMRIYPPRMPELTQEPESQYPSVTYSWEVETDSSDEYPFVDVEWQSIRTQRSNEIDPAKFYWGNGSTNDWRTGTSSATSGGVTVTEDSGDLAKGSWTRWFRARSRGPAGPSAWSYIKHVFAKPLAAVIDRDTKKTFARPGAGSTTKVRVEWTASWLSSNPIDSVDVEYCKATPRAGLDLPADPSWTTALTIADSRETDVAEFVIPSELEADECLWVQVLTKHDVHTTYSAPVLVACGDLTPPNFSGTITVSAGNNTIAARGITVEHNSDVPDSRIALYFHNGDHQPYICKIFAHDETTNTSAITVTWFSNASDVGFSIREFQGTASLKQYSYTVSGTTYTYNRYTITPNMQSDRVEADEGNVPKMPTGVSATYITGAGASASRSNANADKAEVLVDWAWNWGRATGAEISWSQDPHAWESVSGPSTHVVERSRDSQIYVPGLDRGVRWYFRVRFINESDDVTVYGPYARASVLVANAPNTPSTGAAEPSTVTVPEAMAGASRSVAEQDQYVRLNWTYVNEDGTAQRYAEIREVSIAWDATLNENVITEVAMRGKVYSPHRYTFRPSDFRDPAWESGTTHYLQVRVTSTAGLQSGWSNPVAVSVAVKPTCTISATSLSVVSGKNLLTELPLTVSVTGAAAGDTTTMSIERRYDYTIVRPDETDFHGAAGETIASTAITGPGTFTVTLDDLVGTLDDKAYYTIRCTVADGFGQTASASLPFQVSWDYQPTKPTATVTVTDGQAVITPACAGAEEGDFFDIYRLSADKPELIVSGGQWGDVYRDPYPTIGAFGGYRVVSRSLYGDYFDANARVTWRDVPAVYDSLDTIIDFGRYRLELAYNLDLGSSWEKDFTATTYLGGAVQGDWNPAVQRKTTVNTITVPLTDAEQIRNVRRLAVYPGICHIRTPEGSSFAADIQVSESRGSSKLAEFTLTVTRVDPEELDGELVEEG